MISTSPHEPLHQQLQAQSTSHRAHATRTLVHKHFSALSMFFPFHVFNPKSLETVLEYMGGGHEDVEF